MPEHEESPKLSEDDIFDELLELIDESEEYHGDGKGLQGLRKSLMGLSLDLAYFNQQYPGECITDNISVALVDIKNVYKFFQEIDNVFKERRISGLESRIAVLEAELPE